MKFLSDTGRVLFIAGCVSLAAPAVAQFQPLEPVALPRGVEQGVDMVYIDKEIKGDIQRRNTKLENSVFAQYAGAPLDLIGAVNPLYSDLRRGLVRYQARWGILPQFRMPLGPVLKLGMDGKRITLLRERLGLPPGSRFDAELVDRITAYQKVHGLETDGVAGDALLESLNRGALHYAQVLMINMERARRLPAPGEMKRHIIVDAGSAKIFLYEDAALVDSMRAIVGSTATETPMMAALVRYAIVNPYWNVPPDLSISMVAPAVLEHGLGYLTERKYEVFADWSAEDRRIDPASVDWQAVKDGNLSLRIRRGPGPGNSMGDIKFMMPNDFGIYLHDTHDKSVFERDERWISNGCVRVEDARRLATWLFGTMPQGSDPNVEERTDLPRPVAVFLTYFTAEVTGDGIVFRNDRYGRDPAVLARYFGKELLLPRADQQ